MKIIMKRLIQASSCVSLVFAATSLAAILPVPAQAQQVYIGSGNGLSQMIAHPDQWIFVRQHADGYYINFIQLLNSSAAQMGQMSAIMAHKNAYFESDSRNVGLGGFPDDGQFPRALETKELYDLLDGGFQVPFSSLNYGIDSGKLADLRTQGLPPGKTRPCFAQDGPWTFGGDINSTAAAGVRAGIEEADGASTDGPMSLWQANTGDMRSGYFGVVGYTHSLHKPAVVMVSPYNLQPTTQWLSVAQDCVRAQEDAGAVPDIWDVFEYATSTPTLPEAVNGRPADTIMGMAYWLIHHLQDSDHNLKIISSAPNGVLKSGQTVTLTIHNSSAWDDFCPLIFASLRGPNRQGWTIKVTANGRDVTSQMMAGGLPFVRKLRVTPNTSQNFEVTVIGRQSSRSAPRFLETLWIGMRPSQSTMLRVQPIEQRVALHLKP
jgi:hypothetical protein